MQVQDYLFLGMTQSLCPNCMEVVPAKIIVRRERVYFRKRCPRCGPREDYVCSDWKSYDQMAYSLPAKIPAVHSVEPKRGCPYDCGLCTEHEQHTCVGLVELTDACNLSCPMCYAASVPGGKHRSVEECQRAIDHLVRVEGRPEVLQLSGGEPTIHPAFAEILEYAVAQPIDYVQVNTNGIRLAHDDALLAALARHRDRLEVFLQFDGLRDDIYVSLRGEPLLEVKQRAIERLGAADVHITLATTLQGGLNEDQPGPLVEFALARPWIAGINFQPATYSGRHVLPDQLEQRVTYPDVIRAIETQTRGLFQATDFMPLPCAHPNCHSVAYASRTDGQTVPLMRWIDGHRHLDLLANGLALTRSKARDLLQRYLGQMNCCGGNCAPQAPGSGPSDALPLVELGSTADEQVRRDAFLQRALNEDLGAKDLFRIMITSFLDPYNFDLRRLMKCCTHHVLPSGHVIPFCAYNVLYRNGRVSLPELHHVPCD